MAEFDPWFTFAHDYSSHRYDCPIAEGGMANILGCKCGFDKAWSEAQAFVKAAEVRVESLSEALRQIVALPDTRPSGEPGRIARAALAALPVPEQRK